MYFNSNDFKAPDNYSFNDEFVKYIAKRIDDDILKFLADNGYVINDRNNLEEIQNVCEQLKQDDRKLDWFSFKYYSITDDGVKCEVVALPFFDSISNPMTSRDRQILAETWMEKHNVKGIYNEIP